MQHAQKPSHAQPVVGANGLFRSRLALAFTSPSRHTLFSAMTTLRDVFIAAVKSLLRGKNFIQALLTVWLRPSPLKGSGCESLSSSIAVDDSKKEYQRLDDFLAEVQELFLKPIRGNALEEFSSKLKDQFREGLLKNPACMLPSYNHQLPSRLEHGQYLALDVGGSTLRVALVELNGREVVGRESRIVRLDSFKIDRQVKNLVGLSFFDWMAQKIVATVSSALGAKNSPADPLLMGLAWSFPIEQISHKGGRLQGMGKGFMASDGLLGQDLGDIIKSACHSRGIHVELAAIVNDSTAALLSEAYLDSSTRFGLILGTGVNIAVHLPVPTIGRDKFGNRPASWFEKASHVIVNTELGMFGKGILPVTRWDVALNAAHLRPDFQPLEHLVSGCYLGEVCRLVLLEAVHTAGLFGGIVPPSMLLPYSLDTEMLSFIEADTSTSLEPSLALFKSRHPSPTEPTPKDMAFTRSLASFISRRSSAIVAASLFALWQFKNEAEAQHLSSNAQKELNMDSHVVAFNGSVIEQYPQYLQNCQGYLDDLLSSVIGKPGMIRLVGAKESSLLGAAVALACLKEGRAN